MFGIDDAAAAGIITGGLAASASVLNNGISVGFNKKQAEAQREWSEKMYNQQNEWTLNMWNKANEYNTPLQQVQRLREAGLNPLYYGLDGSSANAMQAAQPLGYERANMGNMENPISSGLNAYSQVKSLQKDIELKDAQIDRMKEETSGLKLDNEFKDKVMDTRVEGEKLGNELTKEQISQIQENKKKISAEIGKIAEETKSEVSRRLLMDAQKNVADMEAKEIATLLPYKQLLIEAQSEAQKAAAAASFARAAIDNKLLSNGYVENYIDNMKAEYEEKMSRAELHEFNSAIAEFKSNIRNGKAIDLSRYEGKPVGKVLAKFMNAVYQDFAIIGDAFSGASSAVVGGVVGASMKSTPPEGNPGRTVVKGF